MRALEMCVCACFEHFLVNMRAIAALVRFFLAKYKQTNKPTNTQRCDEINNSEMTTT